MYGFKVCDLAQAYTTKSGGIRTYILEKQKFLNKNGLEHILIIPGETDSLTIDHLCKVYTIASPSVPGCEPYRFILRLDKVYQILQKERPDIIECGSGYLLPYAAFAYRHRNPCSVFGFYHTDFPSAYVQPFLEKKIGQTAGKVGLKIAGAYARFIYNRCDVTIASSTQLEQKLYHSGVKNVRRVFLGVDTELFNPVKRNPCIRQRLGVKQDQLLFIYHGRLDSEKRIPLLLKAFNKVCDELDCFLLVLGEGPYKDWILDCCQENSKIIFMSYESNRNKMAELLASADIYITAGPHETFGLSVLEAQASGLAVAGVYAGALVERVPDHVGLLAEPDSIESMAGTIFDLSTNGFRAKGQNARKLVEDKYSWEKTFQQILNLYQEKFRACKI